MLLTLGWSVAVCLMHTWKQSISGMMTKVNRTNYLELSFRKNELEIELCFVVIMSEVNNIIVHRSCGGVVAATATKLHAKKPKGLLLVDRKRS